MNSGAEIRMSAEADLGIRGSVPNLVGNNHKPTGVRSPDRSASAEVAWQCDAKTPRLVARLLAFQLLASK